VHERPGAPPPPLERDSELDLSPEDDAVARRLHDWRRERAVRDAVPAYVVAPNATLTAIVRRRPETLAELVEIKGFGPTRVEKYGEEILAVLTQAVASDLPDEAETTLY
jgi:ribonuclease D